MSGFAWLVISKYIIKIRNCWNKIWHMISLPDWSSAPFRGHRTLTKVSNSYLYLILEVYNFVYNKQLSSSNCQQFLVTTDRYVGWPLLELHQHVLWVTFFVNELFEVIHWKKKLFRISFSSFPVRSFIMYLYYQVSITAKKNTLLVTEYVFISSFLYFII